MILQCEIILFYLSIMEVDNELKIACKTFSAYFHIFMLRRLIYNGNNIYNLPKQNKSDLVDGASLQTTYNTATTKQKSIKS